MVKESPFIITISRQLGSGGAYIGQRLATRLNILYLDREILNRAAKELRMSEKDLDSRDERVTPRWQSWVETLAHAYPEYAPPTIEVPIDQKLYETQSNIIRRMADENSAVIVGRAGSYVLRQHPRHLSVFLYADIAFRQQRVEELYHVSAPEALKLIGRIDKERKQYLQTFTGQDWLNACQYHLCLDTSVIGLDKAEDIIILAMQARLGIIAQNEKSGSG
jgi:cytidylate kinase